MKANSILKVAVVVMAAIGAYAFSGNNANELYIHQDGKCRDITVACDFDGTYTCSIKTLNNQVFPIWLDTVCEEEALHSSPIPIEM